MTTFAGDPLFQTERLSVYRCDRSVAEDLENKVVDPTDLRGTLNKTDLEKLIKATSLAEVIQQLESVADIFKKSVFSKDREYYGAYTSDGSLVGVVNFSSCQEEAPEIHIAIDAPFQRQGYGKELLSAILRRYWNKSACGYLIYRLRPDNLASEKLVLSLGGELQKPKSGIEGLLMKTYHIGNNPSLK